MSEQEQAEVMTISEVAVYLRLGETTIYRLANKGEIPGRKIGGAWRFSRREIDTWFHSVEKGSKDISDTSSEE